MRYHSASADGRLAAPGDEACPAAPPPPSSHDLNIRRLPWSAPHELGQPHGRRKLSQALRRLPALDWTKPSSTRHSRPSAEPTSSSLDVTVCETAEEILFMMLTSGPLSASSCSRQNDGRQLLHADHQLQEPPGDDGRVARDRGYGSNQGRRLGHPLGERAGRLEEG